MNRPVERPRNGGCTDATGHEHWLARAALLQAAAYLRLDSEGRVLAAAGAPEAVLGAPSERLAGEYLHAWAAPECRGEVMDAVDRTARGLANGPVSLDGLMTAPAAGAWRLGPDGTGGLVACCVVESAPERTDATLFQLADAIPVCIAYVDRALRYRFNNRAYEQFFGRRREALEGERVSQIVDAETFERILPLYRRVLEGEHIAYTSRIDLRDGRSLEMQVDYLPDRDQSDTVRGFYAVIQDVTAHEATIELLRAVHRIVNRTAEPTDETLRNLLELGLDYLRLSIGIVARVEGDRYIVHEAVTPWRVPARGDVYALGDTYCVLTLATEDIVSTVSAGEDPRIAGHPCYYEFGLESYIGVPLVIDGAVWGTVNFSAASPRGEPFTGLERELVRLIGDAVEHLVHEQQLLERQGRERRHLEGLAYRDGLTGLANRQALDRKLESLAAAGTPYLLAMLDLDHFKAINDRWGHEAGDRVLRAVAETLSRSMRDGDTAGRYGGEEFVLVMERTDSADGLRALERLMRGIAEQQVLLDSGESIRMTMSAGLAAAAGDDEDDALRRADRALYRAKAAGRNRVVTA
jgi:diguanylate cyclase (GGDEF)-like protein/PAS domain S-box-containing protein